MSFKKQEQNTSKEKNIQAKAKKVLTKSVGNNSNSEDTSVGAVAKRSKKIPQSVRGFRDVLPSEQPYWNFVMNSCTRIAETYGFERIMIPAVESTSLFERAVGKATDIVEKEMFTFVDRGGDSLTLRPEATAGMARAYIQHGMVNQPQPIKWYYLGSMYRYQRPQYGRQREFHQWDCEVIGDNHPVIDATLMIMLANLYADLGLPVTLQLNSIGDEACRPAYRKKLTEYYRTHKKNLCEDCNVRLLKNPLRLLDCKEEQCQPFKAEAPQFVDHLCDDCRDYLMKILEYLDELDVPYVLNSQLVRGFDYYTRTVFEVWAADDERGKTSLAGGGRYDGLIEMLGDRPTPAAGFALGLEATVLKLKESGVAVPPILKPEVFIAQLGDPAKRKALKLFEELRRSGVVVTASFSKDGLKSQMETAARLGVRFALIIGQKEIVDNTIIIRDMEAGMQETYDFKKVISEIQRKLQTSAVVSKENVASEQKIEWSTTSDEK